MIQRFIVTALKDGIAQITADTDILKELFIDLMDLDPSEVAKIITLWKAKPPKVVHGYAPRDAEPPVWAVILVNETESMKWLHNDSIQITDPNDPNYRADVFGTLWEHTYLIHTYTEHPDMTGYYYEIAKSIILASNDFFTEQGLMDIDISGMDLAPDPRYIPAHLFGRQMIFKTTREFERVDGASASGKAFQVSGIHVDNSGSSSDVGGVQTKVTPYSEGESDG